jgi:hypothetical protein
MSIRRKLAASLLAGAAGALALPGAAAEVIEITTPATTRYYVAPATTYYAPATTTYYYTEPARTYYYEPATTVTYVEPSITVTEQRLPEDVRITNNVIDAIADDPYISGRIAVETYDNDVTLSGSTTTPGQARRAARNAYSVAGVRSVSNELRPKVGGMP